jgi:hypothetical protein
VRGDRRRGDGEGKVLEVDLAILVLFAALYIHAVGHVVSPRIRAHHNRLFEMTDSEVACWD